MRALPVLAAALLTLASGCARQQSARSQRLACSPRAGGPGAPGAVLICLLPEEAALVGGQGWDLFTGVPFCDPAEETYFVALPARLGGFCLGLAGWVAATPVGLVVGAFNPDAVVMVWGGPGYVLLYVGAAVVGAPFWLIREVLWDAPCAFVRFLILAAKDPKGKADYLVPRLSGYNSRVYDQADRKLTKLTGEKSKSSAKDWQEWWQLHRDEFDSKMRRIKPAAPEPAPKVIPAPAPRPIPEGV
jgi:hypothetical protein